MRRIRATAGCPAGSLGPGGLAIPVIVDHAAAQLADFVCGANQDGWHLTGVNWGRDLPAPLTADLRNVVDGDPSPDGRGQLDASPAASRSGISSSWAASTARP